MTRWTRRFALLVSFLAGIGVPAVPAQEVSPASQAVVFAPGSVSVEDGNVFRGAFSPDGREFWFFRKVTEGEEDYGIFVSRRTDAGWDAPERVLLGGEFSELYPSISPDGGRIVFASYRPVPGDTSDHPNANLWYADREPDGSWGQPVLMAAASTLANYDNNPRFRADGAIEFGTTTPDWQTSTRMLTYWTGTEYGPAVPDPLMEAWAGWRADAVVSSATVSPDGALAILDVRERDAEGRLGPSDLWYSRRIEQGWTDPQPLQGGVNTPDAYENFAVFSPDGREILFVRDFHLYWWISTDASTGETPAVADQELAGTSWRLVEFEGGDGTLLIPDDRGSYTLAFGTDGRVSVRVDCNRGSGAWSSEGPSQLSLGPLALTRAMCPPESLHDRIVRDWEYVRSYVLQDGHLFLALTADGGIYEYEPAPPGID